MASIIGNGIVIIALAILIFFSGRSALRQFKKELNGGGCSCCSGGCSGCSSCKTTGDSDCNCGNK